MHPPPATPGYSYTLTEQGQLATIRGVPVPEGMIAVPGLAAVNPASREITQRAVEMTAGIFEFAARANRRPPSASSDSGEAAK